MEHLGDGEAEDVEHPRVGEVEGPGDGLAVVGGGGGVGGVEEHTVLPQQLLHGRLQGQATSQSILVTRVTSGGLVPGHLVVGGLPVGGLLDDGQAEGGEGVGGAAETPPGGAQGQPGDRLEQIPEIPESVSQNNHNQN